METKASSDRGGQLPRSDSVASRVLRSVAVGGVPVRRPNDPKNPVPAAQLHARQRPISGHAQGWTKERALANDPEAMRRPSLSSQRIPDMGNASQVHPVTYAMQGGFQPPQGPPPIGLGESPVLPRMNNPSAPGVPAGPTAGAGIPNSQGGSLTPQSGLPSMSGPFANSVPLQGVPVQGVPGGFPAGPANVPGRVPSPSDFQGAPRFPQPPRVVSGEPWVTEGPCSFDAYEMVMPASYDVCGGPVIGPTPLPPAAAGFPNAWAPPTVLPNASGGLYSANNHGFRPLFTLGQENYNVEIGRGIIGQPTAYVQGQPLRNFLRYLFP